MPKAVVFDLFETLVTESGTEVSRASSLGPALGLDETAFRKAWKQRRPRVLAGRLSFRQALEEIGSKLGVEVDADRVNQACDARVRSKRDVFRCIDPEVLALTRDLREHGCRLAVVSNCIAEDVRSWPDCALAPQFQSVVCSFEVGVTKPDSRIYREATDRLGVAPGDTLFIGDARRG